MLDQSRQEHNYEERGKKSNNQEQKQRAQKESSKENKE